MTDNFAACLDVVLSLEPTTETSNLGFTLETWQQWIGAKRAATLADVLKLTRADVELPYGSVFWRGCNARYLPAGVDLCVFDWCVNETVPIGIAGLHRVLACPEPTEVGPRVVGPITIKLAAESDHGELIGRLCTDRIDTHGGFHRVMAIYEAALTMMVEAQRQSAA